MKHALAGLFLVGGFCGTINPVMSAESESRYINIRNTDSGWVQGGCSLVFALDNGGNGAFNDLTITLQLTDKSGATLETGALHVQAFGDSDATRSINAATEFSCDSVENTVSIIITKVDEASQDGSWHALPLSVFDPQYYQPLKISVGHGK